MRPALCRSLLMQPACTIRPIRSYVLRQSRVSNAQRRAREALLPKYGIAFQEAPVKLEVMFGRAAPKIVEIGFGTGEATVASAVAHPETDYIGIEVHTPGVGSLLRAIESQAIANIRVIQHDAVEVLRHMIPPDSLTGVHIFFPDPWPKKRHHKRRLIQSPFVSLVAQRIEPGGYLHIATDWDHYAEQVLALLSAEPLLENSAQGFAPRPPYRPLTRFEQRGLRLGHAVRDILFRRVGRDRFDQGSV
jgi:tRNA (guanine-N7-)-methyltransferase